MKLRSILIQYRIVLYILSPLIAAYTILIAIKNRDARFFIERYGLYKSDVSSNRLWFHAASVGEVIAVLPLLKAMKERHPEQEFLLTTGTPTGADIAHKYIPKDTSHVYLPLDLPGSVKRFLAHTKPKCAIIMETELWANLYYRCHKNGVPISIINARLSHKTLKTNAWMYRLYAETLSHVSKILARSEEDANGFMTIGATSSKIKTIGNIKLAPIDISHVKPLKDIDLPYLLAASTHDNEEELLARIWVDNFPDKLLVIAPRHPNRSAKIETKLREVTTNLAIRSKGDAVNSETQIYLADTLGELQNLIKGADIVFMGGSLVSQGGHNVIEPARYGKAIIFGPHMENFYEEANLLIINRACIQAINIVDITKSINNLYSNPVLRSELGNNAYSIITNYSDVINKYISSIEQPYEQYQPEDPLIQRKGVDIP